MSVQNWILEHIDAVNADLVPQEAMNEIQDFVLLWSVFEGRFLDTNFKVDAALRKIGQYANDNEIYRNVSEYFKDRYTNDGDIGDRFSSLGIKNEAHKDLMKAFLLSGEPDIITSIKCSMIIVYRFRNNLFHGVKEIQHFHTQVDNFRNANSFLKQLMIDFMGND